ncbi:MAG: hypothetical protein HN790_00225 [Methylococcales bacterium]|jgi:hypothetical protein|nr:hypothetical protein [Methylococcales bacterium]
MKKAHVLVFLMLFGGIAQPAFAANKLKASEAKMLCGSAVQSSNSAYKSAAVNEQTAPVDYATRAFVGSVLEKDNSGVTGRDLVKVKKYCRRQLKQLAFVPKLGKDANGLTSVDLSKNVSGN